MSCLLILLCFCCQLTLIALETKGSNAREGEDDRKGVPSWALAASWQQPWSLLFSCLCFFIPQCYMLGFFFCFVTFQFASSVKCHCADQPHGLKLAHMWQVWSDQSDYGLDSFLRWWSMSKWCSESQKQKHYSPISIFEFAFTCLIRNKYGFSSNVRSQTEFSSSCP